VNTTIIAAFFADEMIAFMTTSSSIRGDNADVQRLARCGSGFIFGVQNGSMIRTPADMTGTPEVPEPDRAAAALSAGSAGESVCFAGIQRPDAIPPER
jgi:hypothetical protein